MGSLNQAPGEPDKYWKQPGHPLHKETKGGRFEVGGVEAGCGFGFVYPCIGIGEGWPEKGCMA